MNTSKENKFQIMSAASDLCQILAMFLNLPDKHLANGVISGTLKADIRQIMRELRFPESDFKDLEKYFTSFSHLRETDALHLLRQEYTRLFTHPDTPLIYIHEALFRYEAEKQPGERPIPFLNLAALDARRRYQVAEFQSKYIGNESEDHMGREIEFLSWLFFRRAKELSQNSEYINWKIELEDFWKLHISRWGKNFFHQCKELTTSSMYELVGSLGELLCDERQFEIFI